MSLSTIAAANTILKLASTDRVAVTPVKLQRVLYITCCEYLKAYGVPMFQEAFRVWQNGPVLPSVQHKFGCYGTAPIRRCGADALGYVHYLDAMDRTDKAGKVFRRVWNAVKDLSPRELSILTTRNGSAWDRCFQEQMEEIPAAWMAMESIALEDIVKI